MSDRQSQDLQLHLQVVGTLLEKAGMYRKPRLDAVKEMVLRILAGTPSGNAGFDQIQDVLCFRGTPLLSVGVLKEAIKALEREGCISAADNHKWSLRCKVEALSSSIQQLIEANWRIYYETYPDCSLDDFSLGLSVLFARYGCGAYKALTEHKHSDSPRISSLVTELFSDRSPSFRDQYQSAFEDFIRSYTPEASSLKFKLASAYMVLRMNGAGNWDKNALSDLVSGKHFLLDTNVLFNALGERQSQLSRVLATLIESGGAIAVGRETLHELEGALRGRMRSLLRMARKGIDVNELYSQGLLGDVWANGIIEKVLILDEIEVESYLMATMTNIEEWISCQGIAIVNLDHSSNDLGRSRKVDSLSKIAVQMHRLPKKRDAARHDVILWECIEGSASPYDMVISQDRILERVRVQDGQMAIMFDELLTYALLGMAQEEEVAQLFSYSLSRDLITDASSFSNEDIDALIQMEASILNAPAKVLRVTAKRLSEYHVECARKGHHSSSDEIQRIALYVMVTHKDDMRELEEERIRRHQSQEEAKSLREANEGLQSQVIEKISLAKRITKLEEEITSLSIAKAGSDAKASEEETRRIKHDEDHEETNNRERRRRDWTILLVPTIVVAFLVEVFVKAPIAATILFVIAILTWCWVMFSSETPKVRLKAFTTLASCVTAIILIIEKYPLIKMFIGIQ